MGYNKVEPADATKSIVTEADKNIGHAEGVMMMDTLMDPIANTIEVAADSLKMGKSIKTAKEMIADSDFLEKEDDGSFVKEPKTEFGEKFQSRLSDVVGPSTEDQMDKATDETKTEIGNYFTETNKQIDADIDALLLDPTHTPYSDDYYKAKEEWHSTEMSKDERTPIKRDEKGNIISGGEAITPKQFWEWLSTQDKWKHLPANPYSQKAVEQTTSGISMKYDDVSGDVKTFYGGLIGPNSVMAHRNNDRILSKLDKNNGKLTNAAFLSELATSETLKNFVIDGAMAYYNNISGGKSVSPYTINRIANGTLDVG